VKNGLASKEGTLTKGVLNRVLRGIFGPWMEEMAGGWRKLHSENFYSFNTSSYIIRMIELRRMRWAEHVARMRFEISAFVVLLKRLEGRKN
jgi:hypothetical protein